MRQGLSLGKLFHARGWLREELMRRTLAARWALVATANGSLILASVLHEELHVLGSREMCRHVDTLLMFALVLRACSGSAQLHSSKSTLPSYYIFIVFVMLEVLRVRCCKSCADSMHRWVLDNVHHILRC